MSVYFFICKLCNEPNVGALNFLRKIVNPYLIIAECDKLDVENYNQRL